MNNVHPMAMLNNIYYFINTVLTKLLAARQNHLHTHALCNDYLQIPE